MRSHDLLSEAAAAAAGPPTKQVAKSTAPLPSRNERLRALASARAGLAKTTPPASVTAVQDADEPAQQAEAAGRQPQAQRLAQTAAPSYRVSGSSAREKALRTAPLRPRETAVNSTMQAPATRRQPAADPSKKPAVAFGRRVEGDVALERKQAAGSRPAPAAKRRAQAASTAAEPAAAAHVSNAAQAQAGRTGRHVHSQSHMRPAVPPSAGSLQHTYAVHANSHLRIEGPGDEAPASTAHAVPNPAAGGSARAPFSVAAGAAPASSAEAGDQQQSGMPATGPTQNTTPRTDPITSEALIAILHGLTAVLQKTEAAAARSLNEHSPSPPAHWPDATAAPDAGASQHDHGRPDRPDLPRALAALAAPAASHGVSQKATDSSSGGDAGGAGPQNSVCQLSGSNAQAGDSVMPVAPITASPEQAAAAASGSDAAPCTASHAAGAEEPAALAHRVEPLKACDAATDAMSEPQRADAELQTDTTQHSMQQAHDQLPSTLYRNCQRGACRLASAGRS